MDESWTIVVGVDFSESSNRAVELAAEISFRTRSSLELVHVWNTYRLAGAEKAVPQIEYWIRDEKARRLAQLEKLGAGARDYGVTTTATLLEGTPSRVLSELARERRAALLVLGRRGEASLAHVLLGSVSERVARVSECPVLVVPRESRPVELPKRLMVGVDFSEASRFAYHAALSIAQRMHADQGLVLAHIRPGERELYLQNWSELALEETYPYDETSLAKWAKNGEVQALRVETRVLEGNTAQRLLSAADAEECGWLVLGVQGRTALAALMMGGSTERVLKLADRPILVVPFSPSKSDAAGKQS